MTCLVAMGTHDAIGSHHDRAVHLNELRRVDACQEFAQADAQHGFSGSRDDVDVLVRRLQADHILHRNHAHGAADRRPQDLQGFSVRTRSNCLRVHQRLQSLEQRRQVALPRPCGTLGQPLLDAPNGLPEPVCGNGLEQVVDGRALEGFDRKLVVGRDEDNQGLGAIVRPVIDHQLGHVQTTQTRHADVEEEEVREEFLRQLQGLPAVVRDGCDRQIGPLRHEQALQRACQDGLVLGDQGNGAAARCLGSWASTHTVMVTVATVPGPGTAASSRSVAPSPNSAASRWRTCTRP